MAPVGTRWWPFIPITPWGALYVPRAHWILLHSRIGVLIGGRN